MKFWVDEQDFEAWLTENSNTYNLNNTKLIMAKFLHGIAIMNGSSWLVHDLLKESNMADGGHN